jgi:hypothetical protein
MVPTFGMFEFELARKVFINAEDQERAAYLNEITLNSTQFGAGNTDGTEARVVASRSILDWF